jgi:isopentenyl phosphate kinase
MPDRTLLKLGGSVITDKRADCAVNHVRLRTIARTLADAPGCDVLIVHGAGSCGHPEARRYRLDSGVVTGRTDGIYVTNRAVSGLNDAVVRALRKEGVPAISIHPLHTGVADRGRLVAFECRHMEQMLALGMVPVIHGDVVMDLTQGACIVSGDQLVRYFAVELHCSRVGLATDVPGVLDGEGRVVPEITRVTASALQIGNSSHTDVTGGMKGKIDELLGLADAGIGSDIFHVSRIGDFMRGSDHGGTRVRGA